MEFDIPVIVVPEDTASGSSQLMNDNDNVLETCRILAISNIDNRLSSELVVGNEIELVDQNEQSMYFSIKAFTLSGGFFYVAIDNEGNPIRPFGTLAEIDNAAANQSMVRPFANLVSPMSKFRIRNLPRPIASMVTDLPRGTLASTCPYRDSPTMIITLIHREMSIAIVGVNSLRIGHCRRPLADFRHAAATSPDLSDNFPSGKLTSVLLQHAASRCPNRRKF